MRNARRETRYAMPRMLRLPSAPHRFLPPSSLSLHLHHPSYISPSLTHSLFLKAHTKTHFSRPNATLKKRREKTKKLPLINASRLQKLFFRDCRTWTTSSTHLANLSSRMSHTTLPIYNAEITANYSYFGTESEKRAIGTGARTRR